MNLKNGMKVFADCETAEYLTRAKEYEVYNVRHDVFERHVVGFDIKNDIGGTIFCFLKEDHHLKNNDWSIVEDTQFQFRLKSSRKKAIQNHRKNNTNYTSDSAYILALIDADMDKFKNSKNEN